MMQNRLVNVRTASLMPWWKSLRLMSLIVLSGLGWSDALLAQTWPVRPINFIQGFAAGGNGDVVARMVGAELAKGLGQPVLVEARSGAGGNIAANFVAKSAPDGYTLLLITGGHAVSAALYRQLPYEPVEDFAPLSTMVHFAFVLATGADSRYKSVGELIAYARSNPGKVSFGSAGIGSTQHLAGELFKSMAGLDIEHIPFRGGTTPVQEVMAGRLDFLMETLTPTLPQIRANRLRPLAVTSRTRSPVLPEIASLEDALPGYEVTSWMGIAAPARTPRAVVERLNREITRVVAMPEIRERFLSVVGGEARASTPEAMREHLQSEIAKWTRVVEAARIPRQ
jgi:tripartite-type tricarboxylate transporter receptor subunit TctC